MKYYVAEMLYNKDGDLIKKDRITGDITDLKWAQQQMNHRFHEKLKQNRDSIGPGDIEITNKKCTIHQEHWDYIVEIISLENQCTANEILLAIAEQHQGNWPEILKAVEHKDFPEDLAVMANLSGKPAITILDQKYPESLRAQSQPPFALFYEGNITLLGSKKYTRLAIGCDRNCDEKLLHKTATDINSLPKDIVIITSEPFIINNCASTHKIILVKPCGLNMRMAKITPILEEKILKNGGLIITELPNDVALTTELIFAAIRIVAGIADSTLIVYCTHTGTSLILSSQVLYTGRPLLVYPTFPEWNNTANNSLIADGACLVENDVDIMVETNNP